MRGTDRESVHPPVGQKHVSAIHAPDHTRTPVSLAALLARGSTGKKSIIAEGEGQRERREREHVDIQHAMSIHEDCACSTRRSNWRRRHTPWTRKSSSKTRLRNCQKRKACARKVSR